MPLAEVLENLLARKQMSQSQLAEESGVSKGYISMMLSGDKNPSLEVLMKISTALDCTIADLTEQPKTRLVDSETEIPGSLQAFAARQKREGNPIPEDDLVALARTQFRGKRPENDKDWAYLYEFFQRTFDKS